MRSNKKMSTEKLPPDALTELKEWQDSQYSPGAYMGMSSRNKPLSGFGRFPAVMIVMGVLVIFLGALVFIKSKQDISSVLSGIIALMVSLVLLVGGVVRLNASRKSRGRA
ncbi:MAG: hypothetical protein N2376_11985 [Clostridia bacterium]|nr:hypothetical protein [Clostridia bacterium]